MNFTDKGMQGVKDTTKRAAAANETAKKFGVNMRDIFRRAQQSAMDRRANEAMACT